MNKIRESSSAIWRTLSQRAPTTVTISLIFLVANGFILWNYPETGAAQGARQRDYVAIFPKSINLGRCAKGETRTFSVQFQNPSAKPVRLVEVIPSCGCALLQFNPTTIPPKDMKSAVGSIRVPTVTGEFDAQLMFRFISEEREFRSRAVLSGISVMEAGP